MSITARIRVAGGLPGRRNSDLASSIRTSRNRQHKPALIVYSRLCPILYAATRGRGGIGGTRWLCLGGERTRRRRWDGGGGNGALRARDHGGTIRNKWTREIYGATSFDGTARPGTHVVELGSIHGILYSSNYTGFHGSILTAVRACEDGASFF